MKYELRVYDAPNHQIMGPLLSDSPFPSFAVGQRIGWPGLNVSMRVMDVTIGFSGAAAQTLCTTNLLVQRSAAFALSDEDYPVPWPFADPDTDD